jgi:adenylate cyclase
MPQSRQLAAILFTDIEGYTAIMQRDEKEAVGMRHRHREILEKEHKQFNGRIVQYYGDGTLSIFQSAVEAVRCAVVMQMAFCRFPRVPVRMGLHIGDIIFSEEHIIGDGVNLASRIESLGVAGCVLISDKVKDEIHNHPEIKTVSVGSYQLKNIERKVEVFALAHEDLVIPALNSLKGKTEDAKSPVQQNIKKFRTRAKSIAVLPFRNISSDTSIEWLSDGFTEELTSAIAGISDIRVKSSTAMMQYKNAGKSFELIAKELNAANFIEGTVQKLGNDILINAHLINPKTGEILRPFRFKKDFSEIKFIYSQMAQEVAENLDVILHSSERQRLQQARRVNPLAHQLYLQGRYACQKLNHAGISEAIILFNKALEIEPRYAPALSGIANCYLIFAYTNSITTSEAFEKAMPLLDQALEIEPNIAFTHLNLGVARMWLQWNLKKAELELIRSNELDHSDAICIQGCFFLNLYRGNIEEAERWREKGLAVAPNDMWLNHLYGLMLFYKGEVEESIVIFQECTNRYGHILNYGRLGWLHILKGQFQMAIDIIETGLNKFHVRRPSVVAWLAVANFQNGDTATANELFRELERKIAEGKPNHSFYTAAAYASIGKKEDAFRLLQMGYELHDLDMLWLKSEPMLNSIRDDHRYHELMRKVGFE